MIEVLIRSTWQDLRHRTIRDRVVVEVSEANSERKVYLVIELAARSAGRRL
jgi:hypothetical protein